LPTGGGGGPGGGAALGAELGGIAVTLGLPVLPLFGVSCEGPHMATHKAINATTATSESRIAQDFTEMAGTDTSPIAR
jgi:surfactin synthase thioesterase subunit